MADDADWMAIEENRDGVRFQVKTGDISLIRGPLIVFGIALVVFAWNAYDLISAYETPSGGRLIVGILLGIGCLVVGLGALVHIVSIGVFYLFQRKATQLDVSSTGLSAGKTVVPIEAITNVFIGNKLGEKLDRQPLEIHKGGSLVGMSRMAGMALENKMADRAYSLNVNSRGIEKRLVTSLTLPQAEFLLAEVQKAISRFK